MFLSSGDLDSWGLVSGAVAAVTGDAAAWEDVARQLDDLKRLDLTSVFLLVQADTAAAYLEMVRAAAC